MIERVLPFLTLITLFLAGKSEFVTIEHQSSTILGMVLLEDDTSLDLEGVAGELKSKWKLAMGNPVIKNDATVLEIEEYNVAIALIPAPIPGDEVQKAARYSYFWDDAELETQKHQAHVIVTLTGAGKNAVVENLLFSKVVSSVLNHSNALGLYMGSRTLVLPKEFYQYFTTIMSEENLPLYIWMYFGSREENGKTSIYTFGMKEFGKQDMEIIDSDHPSDHLIEMMYNMVHYILIYDVTLKDGETIGMSATQKLKITQSKGVFLDGVTLKIEY